MFVFKENSNSGACDMDKNSCSSIVENINNKANIITNLNENNSSSGNRKSLNKSNESDSSSKNSTQNRSSNFYKNSNTPVKPGKSAIEPNKLNKKPNAASNDYLRNRSSNSYTIKSSDSRNGLLHKELDNAKTNSFNLINSSNKLNNKELKNLNLANQSKFETKILMVGLFLLLTFVCLFFYCIY